ncbi:putative cell division protein [Caenibius tardaugens NBRC 16725]|uniref:Putative cell division protein n=1 Tax=Caenibius tardaugens NBRC 16725 TaxID=1219035 RepID=U2YPJ4_9SPHN|nr:cell division protein [Caenibius tardaugens]GAD50825.1 putative cell division protein [Caenibius tardaugens NBRC 16725]
MNLPQFFSRHGRNSGQPRARGRRGTQLLPQARLAGPMPWVIAIMIALTTIAAAGALTLNNVANTVRAELAGGVTVQIVEAAPAERDRQARAALAALGALPGVVSAQRVPKEELDRLMEPWLGESLTGDEAIPVPALIDARLNGRATRERVEALRRDLHAVAPAAQVDAQASWLQPVISAVRSMQYLALALILLLIAATTAAVWLAARTALGVNRDTIEVVHHLGGTDSQIAWIFQRSVARDAVLGGIVGLAVGLIAIVALARQFAALDSGMLTGGGLTMLNWLLLALVPLAGVALATLTARLTVLAALRRML